MRDKTRVVIVGVGPLGKAVLEAITGRDDLQAVGALDVDPRIAGGTVAGVQVVGSLDALAAADVAIHTATSWRRDAAPTIRALLERGLSVVTSSEELAGGDAELEAFAASKGLRVVATGVNPGLVMDRLPMLLASACVRVDAVRVRRVVDLAVRREALQRKMGVGLPEAEARARTDLGHVGLPESMKMLLAALARAVDRLEHSAAPIVVEGVAIGREERLVAFAGGSPYVTLELRMQMGGASVDEIEIDGDPPVRARFEGGIQGDRATVGLLLSAVRGLEP